MPASLHQPVPGTASQAILSPYLPDPQLPQRLASGWRAHLERTLADPGPLLEILPDELEKLRALQVANAPLPHLMDAAYFATLKHRLSKGKIKHSEKPSEAKILLIPPPETATTQKKVVSDEVLVDLLQKSASALANTVYTAQNITGLGDAFDFTGQKLLHRRWSQLGIQLFQKQDEKYGTVFFPSFSLMESLMIYCFGDQALRFCPVAGAVSAMEVIDCMFLGYRVIGLPMQATPIDGSARKFESHLFAEHDVGHGLEGSQSVPLWMQKAAILYIKVYKQLRHEFTAADEATKDKLKDIYKHQFSAVLDLRLSYHSPRENMLGFFLQQQLSNFTRQDKARMDFYAQLLERYLIVLQAYFSDFAPILKKEFAAEIGDFLSRLEALREQFRDWQQDTEDLSSFRDFVTQKYPDPAQRFATEKELYVLQKRLPHYP